MPPRQLRRAAALLCLAIGCAVPATAAPPMQALGKVAPGQWSLRVGQETPRSICIASADRLIQLRHGEAACSRLVIANEQRSTTIHYSCPGAGWGRTTVRLAGPGAVRIATQGIAGNAPFDDVVEAHRTGDCPAATAAMLPRR